MQRVPPFVDIHCHIPAGNRRWGGPTGKSRWQWRGSRSMTVSRPSSPRRINWDGHRHLGVLDDSPTDGRIEQSLARWPRSRWKFSRAARPASSPDLVQQLRSGHLLTAADRHRAHALWKCRMSITGRWTNWSPNWPCLASCRSLPIRNGTWASCGSAELGESAGRPRLPAAIDSRESSRRIRCGCSSDVPNGCWKCGWPTSSAATRMASTYRLPVLSEAFERIQRWLGDNTRLRFAARIRPPWARGEDVPQGEFSAENATAIAG